MRHARTSLVALCWTLLSPPGQGCAQQGDGGPASTTQAGGAAAGSAGSAGKGPSVAGAGVGTAGAGAAAGQAGKGGASWTGPVGVGGMTPQGKTPVWKQVPGDPAGCSLEYLDKSTATLFDWLPYPNVPGGEVAHYLEYIDAISRDKIHRLSPGGVLRADESWERLQLFAAPEHEGESGVWFVSNTSGELLGALRRAGGPTHCGIGRLAIDEKNMFGRVLTYDGIGKVARFAFLRWDTAESTVSSRELAIPSGLLEPTPGSTTGSRVSIGWTTTDAEAISSVERDGDDFRLLAGPNTPSRTISATAHPAAVSSTHFYFNLYQSAPAGSYLVAVHRSDGLAPPTSYLEPEPGWDLGRFGYAHSHIAWVRVTDWKALNNYGRGELWASTFDEDPAKLKPVKLADVEPFEGVVNNETNYAAGFGHYAMWEPPDPRRNIRIWNLAKRTSKAFKVPDDREVSTFLGMTKTHLYLGLARVAENEIFELIRVEVD